MKELICTWFGASQYFDYIERLVIAFYIFKTILSDNHTVVEDDEKYLQLLWECIRSQEFKDSIRATYVVSREVKSSEWKMRTSFKSIMTTFVKTYPHLLSNCNSTNEDERLINDKIDQIGSTVDLKKVATRFMSQLNQFMVSMKVVYPILPEPDQLNDMEFLEPDWIKTMLTEFNGIKSELQWFQHVKSKLSTKCITYDVTFNEEEFEYDEEVSPTNKEMNEESVSSENEESKEEVESLEENTNDEDSFEEEGSIKEHSIVLKNKKQKKRHCNVILKDKNCLPNDIHVEETENLSQQIRSNVEYDDFIQEPIIISKKKKKRKVKHGTQLNDITSDVTNMRKDDEMITGNNDLYTCIRNNRSNLFTIVIKDLNKTDFEYFEGVANKYFNLRK